MKTNVFQQKNLAPLFLTVIIMISALFFLNSKSMKTKLSEEKVKSENLLSEKLKLDKLVANFQKELSELKGKNKQMDKLIAESNQQIQKKANEIEKLIAQNASIPELKKQISELENLKNSIQENMAALSLANNKLSGQNADLNNQLSSALLANKELDNEIILLKAIFSDNYRTEAVKGKQDKLTVNAKRTDKLIVSFDIPSNIGENVHFNVVTPDGSTLSSKKDFTASIEFFENGDALIASNTDMFSTNGTKRMEMTYNPNKKLSKGIYQFQVYDGEKHLGSTQLRLK